MSKLYVPDSTKNVTDALLIKHLERQGIGADDIEFTGRNTHAQFYRHLNSNKRFMVSGGLPLVNHLGQNIEAGFTPEAGGYRSKTNLFDALVSNDGQITAGASGLVAIWQPVVYIDGVEAKCPEPSLLDDDPDNENYHQNVLEWDYGFIRRRLRIIEGYLFGSWLPVEGLDKPVLLDYTQSGDYRFKLNPFWAMNDHQELITPEKIALFKTLRPGFPVVVDDSASYDTTSANCDIYNSNANYNTCQTAGTGSALEDGGAGYAYTLVAQNYVYLAIYYVGRIFLAHDTSGLGAGATISAAECSIYGRTPGQTEDNAGQSDLQLYVGTQADTPTTADYDSFQTTALSDDFSAWNYTISTAGFNAISLNASGIAAINKTGTTKLCIRCTGDINASTPTGSNYVYIWSQQKGEGYIPKLAVTYTVPSSPVTCTPGTLSLTTTAYAPVLKKVVTPGTLSLSTAFFAPVLKEVTTPATLALTLTGYAPVLQEVTTPGVLALTLTPYSPVLKETLIPGTLSLSTAFYAPVLQEVITPPVLELVITSYAPQLREVVTPDTLALAITSFAPQLQEVITPDVLELLLTAFAPVLKETVTPGVLDLTTTGYAPTLRTTITPNVLSLLISTFTPILKELVTPGVLSLTTTGFAPTLTTTVTPDVLNLALTLYAPVMAETITPDTLSLAVTPYAPVLKTGVIIPTLNLTLTNYAPQLKETVTPATLALLLSLLAPTVSIIAGVAVSSPKLPARSLTMKTPSRTTTSKLTNRTTTLRFGG